MPLPPAHFFAGAAVAELLRPRRDPPADAPAGVGARGGGRTLLDGTRPRPWRIWLLGGMLGVLPDMDTGVGILLGRGNAFHGVYTHTLVAVLVVAGIAWMLAGRRWAIVAAAAYASHLVVDLFEARRRTSVAPAWPFSGRTLETVRSVLRNVPWRQGSGADEAALSLLDPPVFLALLAQTAPVVLLFAAVVAGRAVWARSRSGRR